MYQSRGPNYGPGAKCGPRAILKRPSANSKSIMKYGPQMKLVLVLYFLNIDENTYYTVVFMCYEAHFKYIQSVKAEKKKPNNLFT